MSTIPALFVRHFSPLRSPLATKLPPLVDKPGRCKFVSSSMGQANGARDSQFDLRACKMPTANAEGESGEGRVGLVDPTGPPVLSHSHAKRWTRGFARR